MRQVHAGSYAIAIAAALLAQTGCSDDGGDARDRETHDASVPHDGGVHMRLDADHDAGHDAGAWQPPEVSLPDPESGEELWLSEVGLYREIASKQLAPDLIAFEPAYKLWSDGADKQRWLRLPEGERIDSSDMDHWQFPIGTMLFKQFALAGKRLETRLIMRTGPAPEDYWMGAFVWNDDESDARFVPAGEPDVRGSEHDVPRVKNCFTCHDGEAGRVLGFSAVQLPDVPRELLSDPPATPFRVPGDGVAQAALGYLHANCAHCHNPSGTARPDTDMDLRLSVSDRTPEQTNSYRSTVDVAMQYFEASPLSLRIAPGEPDQSGVFFRMEERGPKTQMPPLATELADDAGLDAVRGWIDTLD